MDRITAGDIQATKFHDSPYSTNCALRTLRRAFNRALEKELVRKVPKIKLAYAPRREKMVSLEDEMRLFTPISFTLNGSFMGQQHSIDSLSPQVSFPRKHK